MAEPSTPTKPKQTTPAFSPDTPLHRTSGSLDPSGSGDSAPPKSKAAALAQEKMLELVREELGPYVWDSPTVLDDVCPINLEALLRVQGAAEKKTKEIAAVRAASTTVEKASYPPLADWLNTMLGLCRKDPATTTHMKEFTFREYDRRMADRAKGTVSPLKPDLVGVNDGALGTLIDANDKNRLYWADTGMCGEVKNSMPQAIWQQATYVRCRKGVVKNVIFVPGIVYNHYSRHIKFLFFHQNGITAAPSFDLSTKEGVNDTVRALLGIMSWKDEWDAGFYGMESEDWIQIGAYGDEAEHCGIYRKVQDLTTRVSLIGRSTRTMRVIWAARADFKAWDEAYKAWSDDFVASRMGNLSLEDKRSHTAAQAERKGDSSEEINTNAQARKQIASRSSSAPTQHGHHSSATTTDDRTKAQKSTGTSVEQSSGTPALEGGYRRSSRQNKGQRNRWSADERVASSSRSSKTDAQKSQAGSGVSRTPLSQPSVESVPEEEELSEQTGPSMDRPSEGDSGTNVTPPSQPAAVYVAEEEEDLSDETLWAMATEYWKSVDPTKRPRVKPPVEGQKEIENPQEMVVKYSWVPRSRWDMEKAAFTAVRGKIGVPFLQFSFIVKDPQGIEVSTERFLKNIEPMDLGSQHRRKAILENDPRVLVCTATFPVGELLSDSPTPPSLGEAALHSMIGHMVLFDEGFLQRDVSDGNVLRLPHPQKCIENNISFPCVAGIKEFSGMIIDCDQAVRWRDLDRVKSSRRSGTLPFISIYLLTTWGNKTIHTAIDDLESYVWVVFRTILHRLKDEGAQLTDEEQQWIQVFYEEDPKKLAMFKRSIRERYTNGVRKGRRIRGSRALSAFDPLFIRWFDISAKAENAVIDLRDDLVVSAAENVETLLTNLEQVSHEYYELYLRAGFEVLPDCLQRGRSVCRCRCEPYE